MVIKSGPIFGPFNLLDNLEIEVHQCLSFFSCPIAFHSPFYLHKIINTNNKAKRLPVTIIDAEKNVAVARMKQEKKARSCFITRKNWHDKKMFLFATLRPIRENIVGQFLRCSVLNWVPSNCIFPATIITTKNGGLN